MRRPTLWLNRYARLTLAAAVFLVFAGGMVTSTGSGLAVPDWPLSYGRLFPPMVGGIFYEHSHRMVAFTVGLLTAGLAFMTWRVEPRPWVRRLAGLALVAVILQALLGGLTVIFLLPTAISVAHAAVANLFLALLVAVAVAVSQRRRPPLEDPPPASSGDLPPGAGPWVFLTALVYVQMLLGAVMRHTGAGLAIPDFPLAMGRWIPPLTSVPVGLHFAHRVTGLLVAVTAGGAIWRRLRCRQDTATRLPACLLLLLIPVQILLGGFTIWTQKAPLITSLHVVTGSIILGLALWGAMERWRATAGWRPLRSTEAEVLTPHGEPA
ncbi:MAG: heme A synthase [Acidobacteriota bacterium]